MFGVAAAEQGRPRSLFEAAAQGDVQAAREFMQSTANPNALHPKAVRACMARRTPRVLPRPHRAVVRAGPLAQERTALHLAAIARNVDMVIELLAHKCNVNEKTPVQYGRWSFTALRDAHSGMPVRTAWHHGAFVCCGCWFRGMHCGSASCGRNRRECEKHGASLRPPSTSA